MDSSVAALLLKQQGYEVFAMFMQNWHDTEGTLHGDCEWEEEKFIAEMVARKIGIPFYFVDLSKEYRKRVVDYMFEEYAKGRTPNPDVLCNSEIKFDAFLKAARSLGADMVATGHYCRKEVLSDGSCKLLAGSDPNKDQSYFLCRLNQEQLSFALFPIGDLLKSEVRRLALEADLPSAEKKDSQGICFVGKVDLPVFLQQKLKSVSGEVIEIFEAYYEQCPKYKRDAELYDKISNDSFDLDSLDEADLEELSTPIDYSESLNSPLAKVVGKHDGAQFYTIGQRRGLGIGGHVKPLFVIATDVVQNRIYVGEGEGHKGLMRGCLKIAAEEVHWIRPQEAMQAGTTRNYKVRIRYRQPLEDATLIMRQDALYILFKRPQRGITPGQFAVWYSEDGELSGSGVIAR